MSQPWHMLPGDTPQADHLAAAAVTLIALGNREAIAVKIERAIEKRTDARPCNFLLHPVLSVSGVLVGTDTVLNAWRSGALLRDDPSHPFVVCMTALHNAECILDWMKRGTHHRLVQIPGTELGRYEPGPLPVYAYTAGQRVTSLAKSCALATLGMPLLTIEGGGRDHTFVHGMTSLHEIAPDQFSTARELLDLSYKDQLPYDHPFELAHAARKNRESFAKVLDREPSALILTPDTFQKGLPYNPNAEHSIIGTHAPDKVWERARKHLLGK